MNENVGASFGLSVLIVVFFAVALYQPDPPAPPVAAVPQATTAEPAEAHPPDAPESTPKPADRVDPDRVVNVARPDSPRPPRRAEPDEPRGAFTRVREGETLADVARRVYGGGDDALKTLWLANRDLLDRDDAPVAPGSILRTP